MQAICASITPSNDAGKLREHNVVVGKRFDRYQSRDGSEPAKQANLSDKLDDFWDLSPDAVENNFQELNELFAPSRDATSLPASSKDVSWNVIEEDGAVNGDSQHDQAAVKEAETSSSSLNNHGMCQRSLCNMIYTNNEINIVLETPNDAKLQPTYFNQRIGTLSVDEDERQLDMHALKIST